MKFIILCVPQLVPILKMLIRETLTVCENFFLYFGFFKLRFVFVELFIDEGEGEEDSDDGKLFNSVE